MSFLLLHICYSFSNVFGASWLFLSGRNGGGGGNRTPVLDKLPADIYARVPSSLFIVPWRGRWTGLLKTIPSIFSSGGGGVTTPDQNADYVPSLSTRQSGNVAAKLGGEGEFFVRSYNVDRCFTRPTIVLGAQSTFYRPSRNRNAPMKIKEPAIRANNSHWRD